MLENKAAEETAEKRFKIITPILIAMEEGADTAKITQIKKNTSKQCDTSPRTLERWLEAYAKNGFKGLKPRTKEHRGPNVIPQELIEEAILLRREVPSRSVSQIIEILELEGKAPAGFIKRTTLQDRLAALGYSSQQMKMYQQTGIASRRFVRLNRGDLWSADYSDNFSIPIFLIKYTGVPA